MRSGHKSMAALGASLLCCCAFHASGQSVDACRSIDDDTGRLACYDHVFPRAAAPTAPPAPTAPGRPSRAAATPAGSAPVESTPLKGAAPTDDAAASGDFGLNQRQLVASGRLEKPEEVQNVTARITDRRSNADGEFIVTLDNGQVWAQTELDTLAIPQAGEAVTIHRGLLGSFLLVTSHGVSTRVRRLQ